MQSEHGLSMLNHCLEWDKFVLRTHIPTPDRGLTYTNISDAPNGKKTCTVQI